MLELIKKYESCKLEAYLCPAGIPTIGWGNTFYENGFKVKLGDKISQARADAMLAWYVDTKIKLPEGKWSANQKEALYSLIYNIGQGAFDKSQCKKYILAKDWENAYKNWWWVKANGKVLNGLCKRRQEERNLFFEGLYYDD